MAKLTISASNPVAGVILALAGVSFPVKVKVSSKVAQRISLPAVGLFLSSYQEGAEIQIKCANDLEQMVHELHSAAKRISPNEGDLFALEYEDAKTTPEEPVAPVVDATQAEQLPTDGNQAEAAGGKGKK